MENHALVTEKRNIRAIAFYLPQFHPIPENDEWWGKGFTEWTNVTKAKPLFKGHYQPHLPADLGFYDLRVPEVREHQADLARQYGVYGFCYWHYWFMGRRILERPFNEVLKSGRPDFPFCLGWANESWSRRWHGPGDRELFIVQQYSPEDDKAHTQWLAQAFDDKRYIRIDGRPLLLVWRPRNLPEPQRTTDIIRNECTRLGLPEPFLVGVDPTPEGDDLRLLGFDSTEHHAPRFGNLPDCDIDGWNLRRVARNLSHGVISRYKRIYRYDFVLETMARSQPSHPHFPCAWVGWDNTPRHSAECIIVTDNTPTLFQESLEQHIQSVSEKPKDHQIIFINAWNEWAEGMHLEPDQRNGKAHLEAVAAALRR